MTNGASTRHFAGPPQTQASHRNEGYLILTMGQAGMPRLWRDKEPLPYTSNARRAGGGNGTVAGAGRV